MSLPQYKSDFDHDDLALRLRELPSRHLQCSTTGDLAEQVAWYERMLPTAIQDLANADVEQLDRVWRRTRGGAEDARLPDGENLTPENLERAFNALLAWERLGRAVARMTAIPFNPLNADAMAEALHTRFDGSIYASSVNRRLTIEHLRKYADFARTMTALASIADEMEAGHI